MVVKVQFLELWWNSVGSWNVHGKKNLIWKKNKSVDDRYESNTAWGGNVQNFMLLLCVHGVCEIRDMNKLTRIYWAHAPLRALLSVQVGQRYHRHRLYYWGAKAYHVENHTMQRGLQGEVAYDYWLQGSSSTSCCGQDEVRALSWGHKGETKAERWWRVCRFSKEMRR